MGKVANAIARLVPWSMILGSRQFERGVLSTPNLLHFVSRWPTSSALCLALRRFALAFSVALSLDDMLSPADQFPIGEPG